MVNKIKTLSYEFMVNEQWHGMPPKCRKCYSNNLDKLRRKERRALNRMVEQLVIEELSDDLAYWDYELDKALEEANDVYENYARDRERFERGGEEPDWDYYNDRFEETRRRIGIAYREYYTAA